MAGCAYHFNLDFDSHYRSFEALPKVVVSDNTTNFTSDESEAFLSANGVKHVQTPPSHPASNGLVERAVKTFKNGLSKLKDGSVETEVSAYRDPPPPQ